MTSDETQSELFSEHSHNHRSDTKFVAKIIVRKKWSLTRLSSIRNRFPVELNLEPLSRILFDLNCKLNEIKKETRLFLFESLALEFAYDQNRVRCLKKFLLSNSVMIEIILTETTVEKLLYSLISASTGSAGSTSFDAIQITPYN